MQQECGSAQTWRVFHLSLQLALSVSSLQLPALPSSQRPHEVKPYDCCRCKVSSSLSQRKKLSRKQAKALQYTEKLTLSMRQHLLNTPYLMYANHNMMLSWTQNISVPLTYAFNAPNSRQTPNILYYQIFLYKNVEMNQWRIMESIFQKRQKSKKKQQVHMR